MEKNKKQSKVKDPKISICIELSMCIKTQTGRIKEIDCIKRDEIASVIESMSKIYKTVILFNMANTAEERKENISNVIKNEINHGFEVGLLMNYNTHIIDLAIYNNSKSLYCKNLIEGFVEVVGLKNFSEFFQNLWKDLQPIYYNFGSTSFVVGANPCSTIDILIDLLDGLDDKRSELGDGDTLEDHHMDSLRSALDERSPIILELNELIQMSKTIDKSCSGYVFIQKLVNRIGLEKLPLETQESYAGIFLPN